MSSDKTVSRREFLKIAGIAGATIGVGAGMGGLLSACGSEEETTTTAAAETTTTAGAATTTTAEAETTTTAGVETGRPVKVGFVDPLTGVLAGFGLAGEFCVDKWKEAVADGVVLGDGKNHPFEIQVVDSQSDTNRASQVTADLINNAKVDLVMAAATGDTVNPVADQCEANGMPCLSIDVPVEVFVFQRGARPTSPSTGPTISSGDSPSSRRSSGTCSPKSPPTRRSPPCGPTTPPGTRTGTCTAPARIGKQRATPS